MKHLITLVAPGPRVRGADSPHLATALQPDTASLHLCPATHRASTREQMRRAVRERAYAAYRDKSASMPPTVPVFVSINPIGIATAKFDPAAAAEKSLLTRLRSDVLPYLGYHMLLNILTVDAINYTLEWTVCQDQLLACCDPFNLPFLTELGALTPCVWLVVHTLAYMHAAYAYAGTSWERHANLAVAQLLWFFFEMLTFSHTYAWEKTTYYNSSEGHPAKESPLVFGAAEGHPCPERPYFSTWIPIWQDFVYNTVGQVAGWLLFVWIMRRRRQSRGTEGRV